MRISYDVKGPKRKELVMAVAEETESELRYLGAPSFAYQVGEYQIDKDGILQGPDNQELLAKLKELHDFTSEMEEYDSPLPKEPDYYNPEQSIILQMPKEGFTAEMLENLNKLVLSKESLIKKALGVNELPIVQTEDKIEFPWFKNGTKEELEAYLFLVQGLCELAKKRKRITAKDKPVPNEKFAFRVFLIQLGFVGDKFKSARKILLKNLNGNSAFRDGVPNLTAAEATSNE